MMQPHVSKMWYNDTNTCDKHNDTNTCERDAKDKSELWLYIQVSTSFHTAAMCYVHFKRGRTEMSFQGDNWAVKEYTCSHKGCQYNILFGFYVHSTFLKTKIVCSLHCIKAKILRDLKICFYWIARPNDRTSIAPSMFPLLNPKPESKCFCKLRSGEVFMWLDLSVTWHSLGCTIGSTPVSGLQHCNNTFFCF